MNDVDRIFVGFDQGWTFKKSPRFEERVGLIQNAYKIDVYLQESLKLFL
jgi:hypothetical protein